MIDVAGVDDGGVAVVVLGAFGFADGGLEVRAGNDGHHRHHLLFLHEWMVGIGLGKEELRAGGNGGSGVLCEHGGIGTDEGAVHGGVRAATTFARLEGECGGGEAFKFLRIDACGAGFGEFLTEFVEDRGDDEDDFFTDAEQVVIKRAAFDHVAGGTGEVGGFIDDDDRVSRAGADRALAGFHGCADDGWATGDGEQWDERVLADGVEGFEGGLLDGGDDVIDTEFAEDRLVVGAHGHGGAAGAAGVWIENDRVAGGDHVDHVAG